MDASSTPTFMRTFILWANNKYNNLDGFTFAKMSKKCAQLMQQGKAQGVLRQRVREETLEAFKAACQLQPFKVTRNNAFELLDIANEWEVNTLVTFVSDYIKNKGLTRPDDPDPVQDLVDHAKDKEVTESDLIAVCNIINTALTDDRLFLVPPEYIFEVLIRSDQRSIDQLKLLDFVISLFNENPSSAVPLVPLIDFSRLTKEQDEGIFLCPQLHEENISFFLAWALSSTRNKADRERFQADVRHIDEMSTMKEVIQNAQDTAAAKIQADHNEKIRQLLEIAKRQEAEILDLESSIDNDTEEFERMREEQDNELHEIESRIDTMKAYSDGLAQNEDDIQRVLANEVKEPIDVYFNKINDKINDVNEKNSQELALLERSVLDPINQASEAVNQLDQKTDLMKQALIEANEDISDIKTSIAVKIVRDNVRFDKFIRNAKERMNLFNLHNGEGIWGIKRDDALRVNQQINELVKRIDEVCPLNECD